MNKQNENRPGYKKTKVGWIPEAWECSSFSAITNIEMGQSPNGSSYNTEGIGYPLINGPTEFTYRYPRKKQWTSSPTKICNYGNILLCIRGSSTGRMNISNGEYCIGRGIAAICHKEGKSYPIFIEQLLIKITTKILKLTTGSTFPNIDKNTLASIEIGIPPLPEQKKIAEILSAWDRAIEQMGKLIEAKTKLKEALMQQFLTGKRRFKEFSKIKFHGTALGNFLIPTSRPVPKPNSSYTALGIRSHGNGTFLKTIENPETVMMDTLYEVKEDNLIVNITFAWEGAIAIIKKSDESALVSHRFPAYIFNKDIVIPEYFKYVIQTKRFVHELGLVSPGGAGRNRVMSKTDFLNIIVSIPSVAEQRKIAAVLNGIDKEIDLLKKQLECLKTQKKGLMQKLLTGQIRVKV